MKSDINLRSLVEGFGSFFKRFHTILFFLVVSGGLFAAIVILLSIISVSSSTATDTGHAGDGAFDQSTIKRLETDQDQLATPGSRKSPFVE